ncbi:hypothetical protein ABZV78_02610 [Micromonospora sp. NPDC004540]|uniref:hypothetical protein n=1 Tax=Micromonospora sp. NPDC004540 TaxID=3154457 RepID=UPI0033BC1C0D
MSDSFTTFMCLALVVLFFVAAINKGIQDGKKKQGIEEELRRVGAIEARVGQSVVLFSDPPRVSVQKADGSFDLRPLTSDTVVSVESAGSITAVRGRNLASKAVAGAFTFGAGAFVVGNAKTKNIDNRELYVIIESPSWAHVQKVDPTLGQEARQFAASANRLAKQLSEK